jgi:hypothetical protein
MRAVTELVILGAPRVALERDAWDWALYGASALAAIAAIVAFSAWALELQRRPVGEDLGAPGQGRSGGFSALASGRWTCRASQ